MSATTTKKERETHKLSHGTCRWMELMIIDFIPESVLEQFSYVGMATLVASDIKPKP